LIRRAPRTAAECRDGIPNHGAYGELLMARASPRFPLAVPGIKYNLRCEAVTPCQIGTVDFHKFIEISLGIESNDKRMVDNYLVRWDLVQLRCSNFMGLHAGGTARAGFARTSREFRSRRSTGAAVDGVDAA